MKQTAKKIASQEGEFLNFHRPLISAGLPIMKYVLTPLVKNVSVPLRLTAAASATDLAVQKKTFGSGTTALIISNEELDDIMKIVKSLKESGLRIKYFSETIKNKAKNKNVDFLVCYYVH